MKSPKLGRNLRPTSKNASTRGEVVNGEEKNDGVICDGAGEKKMK
jgi:hypothetical protein